MTGATDYLNLQARLQPQRLAAGDLTAGRAWSYGEFDLAAGRFAAALRERGVGAGDRVAVLAKNRVEIVLLHIACARLGAILVPLNWRLAAGELAALVADAEPHLVLGDALLGAAGLDGLDIEDFAAATEELDPLPARAIDEDAPSLILYTSGTSGRPKGVLLSERNIWQTGLNFSLLGRVTHESVVLCDSPMFHVIGLVTNIRPVLMRGGAFLVSDGFVPARTLARLADPALGVTHYFCVPQMSAMLRADPAFDPAKLQKLTAIFSGGAPLAADAISAWAQDGVAMANGFGMTENGTLTCMPLELPIILENPGAAGVAPPGVELRVVDEAGEACPPGVAGELLVKGPNQSAGYWRRPADTAAAFTADGWFRSGDIARLDANGLLWLVDRKKDMFISGGENVYPAEIEGALAAFPGLAECAVIGIPDERWGEVGHLIVVPQAERVIAEEEVRAYLEPRLARYKLPKYVSVMEALPRNGAGKLVKARLREMVVGK
jgi:fatty-acyl-CoA synthase